jgi:hypothetical protein
MRKKSVIHFFDFKKFLKEDASFEKDARRTQKNPTSVLSVFPVFTLFLISLSLFRTQGTRNIEVVATGREKDRSQRVSGW